MVPVQISIFRGVIGNILGPTKTVKVNMVPCIKMNGIFIYTVKQGFGNPQNIHSIHLNSWSILSYLLFIAIWCMYVICCLLKHIWVKDVVLHQFEFVCYRSFLLRSCWELLRVLLFSFGKRLKWCSPSFWQPLYLFSNKPLKDLSKLPNHFLYSTIIVM